MILTPNFCHGQGIAQEGFYGLFFAGLRNKLITGLLLIFFLMPIDANASTIVKNFIPASIMVNDVTSIEFSITNTTLGNLTGVSFSDNMPAPIWLESTAVTGTCTGFSVTSGQSGDQSITLGGGNVPANSSCTVQVQVRSNVPGTHNSSSTGFTSNQGETSPASNTANLTVTETLSAVCTPGGLGIGAVIASHEDDFYSINLSTGKASFITTSPFSTTTNSVAVNGSQYLIYYASSTGSTANTALYAYDVLTGQHITIAANVTPFGVVLGDRGMGSGGASYYNGSLYLGVEQFGALNEDVIYRLQMSEDGRSILYSELILDRANLNPNGGNEDWGDFVVRNGVLHSLNAAGNEYIRLDLDDYSQEAFFTGITWGQQGGAQRDQNTFWSVSNQIQVINIITGTLVGAPTPITIDGAGTGFGGSNAGAAYDAGGCVPTTSRIGDLVWNDQDGDGTKDPTEIGIAGVTLDLYYDINDDGVLNAADDISGDSVITIADRITTTTTAADGAYHFDNLTPDDYIVDVTDTANILNGAVPTNGADPRAVTSIGFNDERNNIDFGYRSFIVIQDGYVFLDNGTGGGTAHDGVKQGGEVGFEGVLVRVLDPGNANALITSALTDPNGRYSLYIPNSFAGSPVSIVVDTPSGHLSISENVSTTGATNPDTRDDSITFTPVAGAVHNNVNFGDVPQNIFVPDNTGSAQPGQVVFYPHRYTAGTVGTVTFSTSGLDTPTGLPWSHVIYRDTDCSGALNGVEANGAFTGSLAVVAGDEICLIGQVIAPSSAPFNSQYLLTLTADFTYTGETPDGLTAQHVVNDLTTLAVVGLTLDKRVENLDTGGGAVTSNAALPNQRLRYTVTYTNNGSSSVSTLVVRDTVPPYTGLDVPITCPAPVALPNNLTGCNLTLPITANNVAGYQGAIEWSFTGSLAAGQSGNLQFDVRVE